MRVMVVSAMVIVVLVLAGWLIFVIPEWAQRARLGTKVARTNDIDPQLASIDAQEFQARHHVIEAKAQRRRMEVLLRETKKTERDRTKRFEIEQREAERAQRRQMQKDEYRRAAARRRGRLTASIVMVLGIVGAILGGTTLRASNLSLWLIVGGVVLAIAGVWMLSRLEQVAQARRAAIARGEGVFVGRDVAAGTSTEAALGQDAEHSESSAESGSAEAEHVDAIARRQEERAKDRTWQPTALPAPLGRLTHETARQAAFAEGQRLMDATREAEAVAQAVAQTEPVSSELVEQDADTGDIAVADSKSVHDEKRAELAAASEESIEALRRAQEEPEVAELSSVRPDEDQAGPLRGEALDAILQQRRQG